MNTEFNLQEYLQERWTPEYEIELRSYSLLGAYMVQIEKAMEQQGLNNKQLAAKVGVNPSYISKLFNAEKLTNFKMLARIEQALGINFLQAEVNATENSQSNDTEYAGKETIWSIGESNSMYS